MSDWELKGKSKPVHPTSSKLAKGSAAVMTAVGIRQLIKDVPAGAKALGGAIARKAGGARLGVFGRALSVRKDARRWKAEDALRKKFREGKPIDL